MKASGLSFYLEITMSKSKEEKKSPAEKKPGEMHLPVMCVRCARIYMYHNETRAHCPKCGHGNWIDPRLLCKELAGGSKAASQTVTEILWKASDFVETEDINEDVVENA